MRFLGTNNLCIEYSFRTLSQGENAQQEIDRACFHVTLELRFNKHICIPEKEICVGRGIPGDRQRHRLAMGLQNSHSR